MVDLDAARTGEPANLGRSRRSPAPWGAGCRSAGECAAPKLHGRCSTRARRGSSSGPPRSSTRSWSTSSAAPSGPCRGRSRCTRPGRGGPGLGGGQRHGPGGARRRRFAASGVAALIVTEIGRDGTLEGPDLGQLGDGARSVELPVVASGGVGRSTTCGPWTVGVGSRRLVGAIVGRALYEHRFTVAEGLHALRPAGLLRNGWFLAVP